VSKSKSKFNRSISLCIISTRRIVLFRLHLNSFQFVLQFPSSHSHLHLIEVFKILKGFEHLDSLELFELSTAPTGGQSLKLAEPRCRLDVRKLSFAQRVVDIWDSFDEKKLLHVMQLIVSKIDSIHFRMVEGLYKLFELPSLMSYCTMERLVHVTATVRLRQMDIERL
jgi:hypothetical protein